MARWLKSGNCPSSVSCRDSSTGSARVEHLEPPVRPVRLGSLECPRGVKRNSLAGRYALVAAELESVQSMQVSGASVFARPIRRPGRSNVAGTIDGQPDDGVGVDPRCDSVVLALSRQAPHDGAAPETRRGLPLAGRASIHGTGSGAWRTAVPQVAGGATPSSFARPGLAKGSSKEILPSVKR